MALPIMTPIWLSSSVYPSLQETYATIFSSRDGYSFCTAEFRRSYSFAENVKSAELVVSGDTRFYLYLNGEMIFAGPAAPGGDFGNALPLEHHYATRFSIAPDCKKLDFHAVCYIAPDVMTDYSQGHGAFMLDAVITLENGEVHHISTGDDWEARYLRSQTSVIELDLRIPNDEWLPAEVVENRWKLLESPLPRLHEEWIGSSEKYKIPSGESRTIVVDIPRIWAGYFTFKADYDGECGECDITANLIEFAGDGAREHIVTVGSHTYRSLRLQSIGKIKLSVTNNSPSDLTLSDVGMYATYYPVTDDGGVVCSDEMLNKICDVAKHTLKICRQTIHLDSPTHQETLGCTGDYYIESLMTHFSFGDPTLQRFDVVRTARWLIQNNGKMFHTSYSLIWLQMAWDYYWYTADKSLLSEIWDAAVVLLERFNGYTDEGGLIENAPDYMFIDWVPVDDFNMHHPPKCAGQAALNAFYYKALCVMQDICGVLGRDGKKYSSRAEKLKNSFSIFFDSERGLYFSGKNGAYEPNMWLPEDNGRVYYTKHANILAVLYGLCDEKMCAPIMEKVINDDSLIDVQPYFMHFLLEALDAAGLFEKYGIAQLHRFDIQVNECKKGFKEGWGAFVGDYSHAWGGTALYKLPQKLLGFKMEKPGFEEISLKPQLFGLKWAKVDMPTPFGMLTCIRREGEATVIQCPKELKDRCIIR